MSVSETTHVIFDYCGTIADIFGNIGEALEEYALSLGKIFPSSLIGEILSEKGAPGLYKYSVDFLGIKKDEKTLLEFETLLTSKVIDMGNKMIPGVEKLIKHLHENNIPMAIATDGKNLNEHADKLIGFDLKQFSHYVCGLDDPEVKNNKPAPDIYLVCASRFKYPPKSLDNCVIFEDSIVGITGAVATGMKTVLINNSSSLKSDRIADKITVIADSYDDFKPESIGLPPY